MPKIRGSAWDLKASQNKKLKEELKEKVQTISQKCRPKDNEVTKVRKLEDQFRTYTCQLKGEKIK